MNHVNDYTIAYYLKKIIKDSDKINDYLFSVESDNWRQIFDYHIKGCGVENFLLACKIANKAEVEILDSELADDYCSIRHIVSEAIFLITKESDAREMLQAYLLLKSVWGYREVLEYPIDIIKTKIDNESSFYITPPYANIL